MHYLKEDAKNLVIKELLYFGLELLNLGCLLVKYERCNKTPYFKKTLPARPYYILYPIHSAWCQVIISFSSHHKNLVLVLELILFVLLV